MTSQTYQEVTGVVLIELKNINFKSTNIQEYFYQKQTENPKKYERLFFNSDNYSQDLENILFDLNFSGSLISLSQ